MDRPHRAVVDVEWTGVLVVHQAHGVPHDRCKVVFRLVVHLVSSKMTIDGPHVVREGHPLLPVAKCAVLLVGLPHKHAKSYLGIWRDSLHGGFVIEALANRLASIEGGPFPTVTETETGGTTTFSPARRRCAHDQLRMRLAGCGSSPTVWISVNRSGVAKPTNGFSDRSSSSSVSR